MKPHDSLRHWGAFSLAHWMGEGRGEGFFNSVQSISRSPE